MNTYEFTFILDREPTEAEVDALFEPFEGSALPEFGGPGPSVVHVQHEADTLMSAILDALVKVENVGLAVVGIESEDAVSLKDIAARTGRTYASVRMLATGERGPGGFPASLGSGQWALYSWAEVSAWFAAHYGTDSAGTVTDYDREIAAADHLLRARRILAEDVHRGEFAQLVDA